MHDVLRSKIQNPFHKFHNNFINFEKPLKFSKKSQNLGQMHEKEGLRPLPSEEKLDLGRKIIGDEVWSERERFREWRGNKSWERSRGMRYESCWPYIYKLSNSRHIERCQDLLSFKRVDRCSYRVGVHSKKKLNGSRSYREVIEDIKTFSMDRGAIKKLLRLRLKEFEELDR